MKKLSLQHLFFAAAFFCTLCILALQSARVHASPGGPVYTGYLLDDNFPALTDKGDLSGWDLTKNGGQLTCSHYNSFKITDSSNTLSFIMNRKFVTQNSGSITLEYRFKQPTLQEGFSCELKGGNTAAVNIRTAGTNICYINAMGQPVTLRAYSANVEYGVRVVADIDSNKARIFINGVLLADKVDFCSKVTYLDNVNFKTGDAGVGDTFLLPVQIHKGYLVNERFISGTTGNLPTSEWSVANKGGTAAIQSILSASKPDIYSLLLQDTSMAENISVGRTFTPQTSNTIWEYKFLLPEALEGVTTELLGSGTKAFKLFISNGKIFYTDSTEKVVEIQDLKKNLWYHVKVFFKPAAGKADIYINYKLKCENVLVCAPGIRPDTVKFATPVAGTGALWLDDVLVYPQSPAVGDYVPVPSPVSSAPYIVGMQSCSLWKEGTHRGWDRINPYPERKPYLGYYEDGSPEVADWEIKWMVEHGIDYELFCWYSPSGANGNPIKNCNMDAGLHEGYFNAKYSDKLKFAIMWENGSRSVKDISDFRNNFIPFWIEYYFKDPRYLKIDNKPVFSIYSYTGLIRDFTDAAGIKAELDYLRNACREAGFEDVIILSTYSGTDASKMAEIKNAGIDTIYAYSWGNQSGYVQSQQIAMENQRNLAKIDMIPTLGMGRDNLPWYGAPGKFASPSDFEALAKWTKEQFMPTLPENSLGRKMVILDNWNEYGEGHFIMPTNLYGFGYLDAIRSAFTAGKDHQDILPTQAQKDRINILYPSDRILPEAISPIPPVSDTYKKLWQFDTGNEGWTKNAQVSGVSISNGCYNGTATGTDPVLMSPSDLNIDITDSPYIRIKMKNSTRANDGVIYFVTASDTTYDEKKSVHFFVYANDPTYTEYIVPMYTNQNWIGIVKQIRFDPTINTGSFSIDYIGITDKARPIPVSLEGWVSPDFYESMEQSPLKQGFQVEILNWTLRSAPLISVTPDTPVITLTGMNGSFSMPNLPDTLNDITIRISKEGYLTREFQKIKVEGPKVSVGLYNSPVLMWAGDMDQDGAINMTDIMEIARVFNTSAGSGNFKPACDLNKDNSINMADIMIAARHFNQTSEQYTKAGISGN